ncbi:MAG TPA: hypothetical protein VM581_03670 [Magnetospirillaceae bacterium]|nr:hypothetical protein [Magnetospirillaceae bacterium]
MQGLEKMLEGAFKSVPPLPEEARKGLATAMPWLALAGGVLSLIGAWYLYQAVAWVDRWANYANELSQAVGYSSPVAGVGVIAWISIAILVLQAVLSFVAFPALRTNKKSGWNLMLLMALATVVYGIVANLFSGYMNIGGFVFSLIGSTVGLYLLFQVRSYFGGAATTAPTAKPVAPAAAAPKTDKKA